MGENILNKELQKKINLFSSQAELMPSVVIIQQLEPFVSIYMSKRGLRRARHFQRRIRKNKDPII